MMPRFLAGFTGLWLILTSGLQAEEVVPAEREAGFVSLFDGATLSGWTGAVNGYEVVDGAIQCRPNAGGNLLTEKEYADFELRFEFRLPPGGNNGIGLRAPARGHVATEGLEIQILDNTAAKYKTLAAYQYHGSVYGLIPARRGFLREVGVWNEQSIRCVGPEIEVRLNGEPIAQGRLDEVLARGTLDGKDHPGARRPRGHIGFLGHNDPVAFRSIRIREIPPSRHP
ncbi:MAG: DUF1080 domain-containing protein [Planctomycetota bacterium]|nr:MAG: DUF1080 domain-containing protein [Planctomycetota bacterium]